MAKPGLPKKKKGGPSPHSRAARRAISPPITDKALDEVPSAPKSDPAQPSILAIHQGAGVTKKSKKGRKAVLSSRARRRHERDIDRAEAIVERTAKKVAKSTSQLKAIRSRRKPWEEVNSAIAGQSGDGNKIAKPSTFAVLGEHWETDEEVGDAEEERQESGERRAAEVVTTQARVVPQIVPMVDDEEEIL